MKIERVRALGLVGMLGVVGVAGGCGILNGLTDGDVRSPFAVARSTGEGEGEGEGEDEPGALTTTPVPTATVSYQQLTTVNRDVSFGLALPEGYADNRFAVVVVAEDATCLPNDLAQALFDSGMALVSAAALTAEELTEVFEALERDINLDDNQTFALTAGDTSANTAAATRVGDEASAGLLMLSPGPLPPEQAQSRSANTTVFATAGDALSKAMAADNEWDIVDVGVGARANCGLLDRSAGERGEVSDIVEDLLLARP